MTHPYHRFTQQEEDNSYAYDIPYGIDSAYHETGEHIEKLGRIEDLEEDFGIPLTTLFKALNQFFSKEHDCYVARPISLFRTVQGEWMLQWMSSYFRLKDYGITWALTREELE